MGFTDKLNHVALFQIEDKIAENDMLQSPLSLLSTALFLAIATGTMAGKMGEYA